MSKDSNALVAHRMGVTFIRFRGRAWAVVGQLGAAMGYAEGALGDLVRRWSTPDDDGAPAELVAGVDFLILRGDDLREFKAVAAQADFESVRGNVSQLTVLSAHGVNIVCLKTEKALGRKLRRFLAEEVMPRLEAGEALGGPSAEEHQALREQVASMRFQIAALERRAGRWLPMGSPPLDSSSRLPVIQVTQDFQGMVDAAVRAVKTFPGLGWGDGRLWLEREQPAGAPRDFDEVTETGMIRILSNVGRWLRWSRKAGDWVGVDPPRGVAWAVLSTASGWISPDAPRVVEHQTFRHLFVLGRLTAEELGRHMPPREEELRAALKALEGQGRIERSGDHYRIRVDPKASIPGAQAEG